ncbi:MAG: DUF3783 domain-containing protein [Bacillota bacterium]|nr:DUF3783 domain-containing protein [Bacillota bacterium]
MTRKLLVYNMPAEKLEKIMSLKDKYQFDLIETKENHLGHKVGNLLEENFSDQVSSQDLNHIDINFLMIHGFADEDLNQLLKDFRDLDLKLPNKCVSTETNKTWILQDLLKENQEEAELMPLLHKLYSLRKFAQDLIDSGKDDPALGALVEEITAYINKQDLEKNPMIEIYNKGAQIVNQYIEK